MKNPRDEFSELIETEFFHDNPNYDETYKELTTFLSAYDTVAKERDDLLSKFQQYTIALNDAAKEKDAALKRGEVLEDAVKEACETRDHWRKIDLQNKKLESRITALRGALEKISNQKVQGHAAIGTHEALIAFEALQTDDDTKEKT